MICSCAGKRRYATQIGQRMLKIHVTTADGAFVGDLNAAKIEGVRAEYRPTMAVDSMEHIAQIVVVVASQVGGRLFSEWLASRLKKPLTPPIAINNYTTINAQNVVQIIQRIAKQRGDQE